MINVVIVDLPDQVTGYLDEEEVVLISNRRITTTNPAAVACKFCYGLFIMT